MLNWKLLKARQNNSLLSPRPDGRIAPAMTRWQHSIVFHRAKRGDLQFCCFVYNLSATLDSGLERCEF